MEFFPYLLGLESPFFGRGAIATGTLTALCETSGRPGCVGSMDTHLLAETLYEGRLLFVAAAGQAFPAACVAEIEGLDEIPTGCGMVRKSLGLSAPRTHRRVCQKVAGACQL